MFLVTILNKNNKKSFQKWICGYCIRLQNTAETKTKTYSHTILSPKTKFPTRPSNQIKEEIQKTAQFAELYNWQRENLNGPEFILQDGPPYANGDLHMGHAVNKIIKDINNRSQVLQGNRVYYKPGWDCHGLPIELKALQKAKKKTKNNITNPKLIREIARKFALETVENQKSVFKSWGVMADWDDCYLTLNKSYVQNQLRQFYKMYEKGLVMRALKPVYWSPSSKTALAEAELEYDPQFKSTEVYVAFPLQNVPTILQEVVKGAPLSAIIWTTTPWTLPANRAICYNKTLKYSIVKVDNRLCVVSSGLVDALQVELGVVVEKVFEFEGDILKSATYTHPLVPGCHQFLHGDHVTEGKGTGLVHTAPAHGPHDFLVALNYGIDVTCNVDESGCYTNLSPTFNGLYVLTEGQDKVISSMSGYILKRGVYIHSYPLDWRTKQPVILRASEQWFIDTGAIKELALRELIFKDLFVLTEGQDRVISSMSDFILKRGVYIHSYPLDWRTKQPVILRASEQWFIDTGAIKELALAALDKVEILPPSSSAQSRQGFRSQIEKRPYWCISRQRAWGVPIPALYKGNEVIMDKQIIENLCNLIETHGTDVWWSSDVSKLLPNDVIEDRNLDPTTVTKGEDILDIWFDSGISWSTIDKQASLYSEGLDQLTGWFQSSLLTSVALTGEPPYNSIFVHGFVVDEMKRKMSKSIGNVIAPKTIVHGGKDKNLQPAYGIDTLRWWVASHSTQHSQIVISKKLLDDCQTEVIRIRNILKYLLGVISDLPQEMFQEKPKLNVFDEYLIHESQEFLKQINEHYNNFRYNHAAQTILHFISNKISGLYCHCVKDRLYCSDKKSLERISAQLVLHTILVTLSKAIGPILPHLVEEAWQHHPLKENPFHFTKSPPILTSNDFDVSVMDAILNLKKAVNSIAKNENLRKFSADVRLNSDLYGKLKDFSETDVLCEILEVESVNLVEDDVEKFSLQLCVTKNSQCLRCRKYNVLDDSDKCERCEKVLASQ